MPRRGTHKLLIKKGAEKMSAKCTKYDNLSDVLEYGNISDQEAISICNEIIRESISETDHSVLEAMFHAVFTGVVNRKIAKELHTESIISNLESYSEAISDYVITILACTGKLEYESIIKQLGEKYPSLDAEEALQELKNDKRK